MNPPPQKPPPQKLEILTGLLAEVKTSFNEWSTTHDHEYSITKVVEKIYTFDKSFKIILFIYYYEIPKGFKPKVA